MNLGSASPEGEYSLTRGRGRDTAHLGAAQCRLGSGPLRARRGRRNCCNLGRWQEQGIFQRGNPSISVLPQRIKVGFTKKGDRKNSISQSRE